MNNTQQLTPSKINYEVPTIDNINFSYADIITTSVSGDENQGEWDPQAIGDDLNILKEKAQ